MWLNFATCAACLLFLQGMCQCYQDRDNPRATSDCISCKCLTLWHVMKKKKKARKYLYHMNNETCGCNVACLSGDTRCTKPGSKYDRIAYHPECMKNWIQCDHMKKVSEQLEQYSLFLAHEGKSEVPRVLDGCCPLIGYSKKISSMIKVENPTDFVLKRRKAIWTLKLHGKEQISTQYITLEPQDEIMSCDMANFGKEITNAQISAEPMLEQHSLHNFLRTLKNLQIGAFDTKKVRWSSSL